MSSRMRLDRDGGFALIELLVVILIVGILAAVALPTFLLQRSKGEDAGAKSNARNAVTEIESCFTGEEDFRRCDESSELQDSGYPVGARADYAGPDCTPPVDGVCVNSQADEYRVTARSRSGNLFTIDHADHSRTCIVADPDKPGGCRTGGGTTGTW